MNTNNTVLSGSQKTISKSEHNSESIVHEIPSKTPRRVGVKEAQVRESETVALKEIKPSIIELKPDLRISTTPAQLLENPKSPKSTQISTSSKVINQKTKNSNEKSVINNPIIVQKSPEDDVLSVQKEILQNKGEKYKLPNHQNDTDQLATLYCKENIDPASKETESLVDTIKTNITFAETPRTKAITHEVVETATPKPQATVHKLSSECALFVRSVKKLSSVGPLTISDLGDFLEKSKKDFEYLYSKKTLSNLQISDFSITKTLGVGGFGKVVLAELKKDGTLYAVKLIDKVGVVKRNHVKYVSNEKRILQALNFPFVINLKFFFADFYNLYFVMPFIPGGNFYRYLKTCQKIKESDAKFYIGQLVLALEYLHYLDLVHRDVKTENIVIDAFGYLKLVDFGQCVRFSSNINEKTYTFTGTPDYMAPEIFVGKGYDCAVDWWALGIITYELCAGFRPFKHENPQKLQLLILCNQYTYPNSFSRGLKKMLDSLFVLDPKKRIANRTKRASGIKKLTWFNGLNWLALLNRTLEAPYLPDSNRISKQYTSKV